MASTKTAPQTCFVASFIFDMDGVIINSHPAHLRAWQDFLRTIDKEVPPVELDFILDGRKRREILRHFVGDVSDEQLAEYGRRKDQFFQERALEVEPMPGVIDFINDLRAEGIALAVATSASKARTASTLRRLGLIDHFQAVVTGDDVTEGKPDPAIYLSVCRQLKAQARDAIAVEDAVSGILAAKAAGLRCIGVSSSHDGQKLKDAGADHVIENFEGLSLPRLQRALNGKH